MRVILHDPSDLDELRRLVRQEQNAKQRDRYRVVLIAAEGIGGLEVDRERIAATAGRSRQFVDQWAGRYRRGGIAALLPRKQPGRVARLTPQQVQDLKQRLDAGPVQGVDARCVFFGQDICRLIEREFGQIYSLSGVYKLLERIGYSWLCPRPRHPQGDPAEQEAFKKTSPSGSSRFVWITPANAS